MRLTGRHAFNPSAVYITELAARRTTPDSDSGAKLPPYLQMGDDRDYDVKVAPLEVPPPSYTLSVNKGGLRARSRSPAPDRKAMP